MSKVEITCCLIKELAKLLLRSDDKPGTIIEAATKFLNTNAHAFNDIETLTKNLEEDHFAPLFNFLFGEEEEPCYLPFTPGYPESVTEINCGFLVHIFKGEQDIVPLSSEKITITPKQYYRLLHTLRHDLKRLESPPCLETWLYLMQRYSKWIPANERMSYISLYHYTRIKIALTGCICREQIQAWQEDQSQDDMLAVVAVQIFGKDQLSQLLHSSKNLNLLKGEEYYLQMLREYMVRELLAAVDLPLCNCLFEGKDKFLLLVRSKDAEAIHKQVIALEKFLLQHFQGILHVGSHFAPISLGEFKQNAFIPKWKQIWQQVDEQSCNCFSTAVSEDSHLCTSAFAPVDQEQDQQQQKSFKSLAQSLEQLGKNLIKTRWIAVGVENRPEKIASADNWQQLLAHFGANICLLPRKPETDTVPQIYRFGNTDFACPGGMGFKFSESLPYLMADQDLEKYRMNYWSVLNLRIDGIPELEKHSLGSFLTTHEYLQDFFRTYLSSLLREKKYRRHTYMLYTANHLLTIVCSPQITLMLTNQIYQKFCQFTNNRFTLSGRISISSSEYPIQQLLFEEQNKFKIRQHERNYVEIMGEKVAWSFIDNLLHAQDKLSTIAKLKGKRFLFPLLGMAEIYRMKAESLADKKAQLKWRNAVHYYLSRLGITDNLEGERGPVYLSLAIQWNHLMSQEA